MIKKWLARRLESLKYWLAEKLNRNPEYCWAELVLWAINRPVLDILRLNWRYKARLCWPGETYCGKCDHIKQRMDWMKYR